VGALLSTYKVITDYLEKKRKIKVVSYGFGFSRNIIGPSVICLEALNMGNRDVTLNSMGFILLKNKTSIIIEPNSNVIFPYTLSDGKSCIIYKEQEKYANELKRNGYTG